MYACVVIDALTNQCSQWAEMSFIPTLTDEARDTLLLIVFSTYLTVLVVRSVKGLLTKAE